MCNNGSRCHLPFFLCGIVLLTVAGCVIIPVDYHAVGVRHNVNLATGATLQSGVTTQREVFLLLGEPDFFSEDGQRIGYAWTKVKMLILWASYGGSGGAEIQRSYILEISFTNQVVATASVIKEWGPQITPNRDRAN